MSARFGGPPTSPLARAAAMLSLIALVACSGETLYDTGSGPDVPGPTIRLVDPTAGAQITTGRQVRIRVEASDSLGVSELEVTYRGVATGTIMRTYSPPQTTVVLDTLLQLPAGTGELELRATARNGLGGASQSQEVALEVVAGDETAPSVSYVSFTPARMELGDSIRVRVTAADNSGGSGLARLGLTVLVRTDDRPDTLVFERSATYSPARADQATEEFAFPPPFTSVQDLPRTMALDIFAFAVDSAGNCRATAGSAQVACAPLRPGQPEPIIAAGASTADTTIVVTGTSVRLPANTTVADAVVDMARQRLYLSSVTQSKVEIMDLTTRTFGQFVRVGSEPWGLALNRSGDTLIVGNSGGTNISYVPLQSATPTEDIFKRIRTPNNSIFVVARSIDQDGLQRLGATIIDFSDRPQFIAQDYLGRLLYSTRPTNAAPDGTLRIAVNEAGWQQPEVRLLLDDLVTEPDTARITIAHVDSLRVFTSPGVSDRIEIYDHVPGFPNSIVRSGIRPLFAAIDSLQRDPDSDILWRAGDLDLQVTGLRDTTYVAASGDRRRIAFGEGAASPGRIIMWNAPTGSISNEITVADLVGNASERVTGIALNNDGTLNVARGTQGAYFFKEDLRLQGFSASPVSTAGSGAQLHPDHPTYNVFPPSGPNTLGFVAAGDVIRIFDTVHFSSRGQLPVRDPITGPLRVSRPPAGATGACPGPDCVVARLYGVTNAGTIVIVDVRTRDILQP